MPVKKAYRWICLVCVAVFASCVGSNTIVNSVDEREANEIVVFLASKGIAAHKIQAVSSEVGGGSSAVLFNIGVEKDQETEAMALLNQYGLPRRKGTNLLELFAKTGLMSSDKEETVRYQAGLAEEIKNTIRKMDGVLDADVQLSFPSVEALTTPGAVVPKTTAAVYVKHQGVFEDPNSHLESKIKRLLSGSVTGLDYDNVSVISDRSRLAEISLDPTRERIGGKAMPETHVSIWSMVLTKSSLNRFRFVFFSLISLILLLAGALGWMVYRFYPLLLGSKPSHEETM